MRLVIAEKPPVGRMYAKVLGANEKKNGYLHPQFFVDDGISGTTFAEVR